jgi:4-hydroxy-3-polyprenylbenzoate decarboxylase
MRYRCLQTFLQHLDKQGELRRIEEEISPLLEVTKLAQIEAVAPCPTPSKTASSFDLGREGMGGKALLLEHIKGCDFPLVINAFGSYHRMEEALGGKGLEEIADMISSYTNVAPPSGLSDLIAMAKQFKPLMNMKPKRSKGSGICQDVVQLVSKGEVDAHYQMLAL